MGDFLAVVGLIGFIVTVFMFVKQVITKKGWGLKKTGIVMLISVIMFFTGALIADPSPEYQAEREAKKVTEQKAVNIEKDQRKAEKQKPKGTAKNKDNSKVILDEKASKQMMDHIKSSYGSGEYIPAWYSWLESVEIYDNGKRKWAVIETSYSKIQDEDGEIERLAKMVLSNALLENIADLNYAEVLNSQGSVILVQYNEMENVVN